jgi:hypothetical protein
VYCTVVSPRTRLKHECSGGVKLKIARRPGAEQCCYACVDAWNNEAGAGHCADKSISLAAGVPLSKNRKLQTSICKRFVNRKLN